MKFKYEFEVDGFEKGNCFRCPLAYDEYYDDDGYREVDTLCVLHTDECPLEEVE